MLFTVIYAQACDKVVKADYEDQSGSKKIEYKTMEGYYKGSKTWYWEFGPRSLSLEKGKKVGLAPIWVPQYKNKTSAGKNDVLPCEVGYSDFWEVNIVEVGDTVPFDFYKSAASVQGAGSNVTITKPGAKVNCPVVPFNSTITDGSTNPNNGDTKPKNVLGWYKDKPTFYFDFGMVEPVTTLPVWVFTTADGTKGGKNLIDSIPGDAGYTPFWQPYIITVPDDQKNKDTFKSAADVTSSLKKVEMDAVVNCPVAFTEKSATSSAVTSTWSMVVLLLLFK